MHLHQKLPETMQDSTITNLIIIITLAASSGKSNVTVWPLWSPSVFLYRRHIHRDSPGGNMQRGQCTFQLDNKEDLYTC